MLSFINDTYHLLVRHIRTTLRIPIWIAVALIQPVIWLVLFGQLFGRVVELDGFETASYIQFLTPGVVIMTAFFGGAWSGVGLIEDINNGVLDRMLATSVHRGALIAARLLHATLVGTIQSSIILGLGLVLGAGLPGGFGALLAVLLAAALLGAGFSAISNALALLTRHDETMVALIQFFGMPLAFLSTSFMAIELMPAWMRVVALGNPVNWAVSMARQAMLGQAWPVIWSYTILLAAFVLITGFLATQAFQLYRRAD